MAAYFDLPLDLQHASKVAWRISYIVDRATNGRDGDYSDLRHLAAKLGDVLAPFRFQEDDLPRNEAAPVVTRVIFIARQLVDEIERLGVGEDQLGQAVRNLFELLEHGQEGAEISLRAGENPQSLLRPI
jgi:hypothetical protein